MLAHTVLDTQTQEKEDSGRTGNQVLADCFTLLSQDKTEHLHGLRVHLYHPGPAVPALLSLSHLIGPIWNQPYQKQVINHLSEKKNPCPNHQENKPTPFQGS